MCGFVGIRRSWCPDARARVESALDALRWRGPDGVGIETAGDWLLGVARLAISDPDASQPLRLRADGPVVAFNGAVTSAADDWPRFAAAARTRNDAELLLHRLAAAGPGALGAMTGPYAFAVVDAQQSALWLGRDPEGEKPLLVAHVEGRVIAFASTAPALRAAIGRQVRLDEGERARLLQFGMCGSSFAVEDEVRVREVDPGVWSVRDRLEPVVVDAVVQAEGGAAFATAFRSAVERCATAEVDVGLSLSGGIDSACIAAVGRGRRWPAYQFRAVGEPDSERRRAATIAARFDHDLRPVDGSAAILRALPELTRAHGLPLGDPSVLAAHAVARRAAADGVRVLLSGEGADDLLLGYRRHRAAARLPRRGLRWLPALGGRSRREIGRLWRALRSERPYDELLRVTPPGFAARVFRGAPARPVQLPVPMPAGVTALQRARVVDRVFYLRRDLLPKLDVATLAAGVEGRCPFLDPAVLASDAVTEPDPRRVLGKRALIDAFADELPPGFTRQRKTGFAIPLDRWLREDDFLADVLRDRRTLERPHVDAAGLTTALDRHRAGALDCGHPLYLVVALELHDRDLEGGGP